MRSMVVGRRRLVRNDLNSGGAADASAAPPPPHGGPPPRVAGRIHKVTYSSDSMTHWPVTLRQAAR